MAGAHGRVLDRDGGLAQPGDDVGTHLGRVIADNDDDPFTAQGLGGIDGVIQHGASADRVQHLGQAGFHPGALPRCQNNGGAGEPGVGFGGHVASPRLVVRGP